MTKIININGQRFALPANMTSKDIQALAGFLISLTPVEQDYDYDTSNYLHSESERGAEVRIENLELVERAAAKAHSTASYDRYKARNAAAKEAA